MSALRKSRSGTCNNVERRERTIVKVSLVSKDRYRVSGAAGSGVQYRPRHGMPNDLLEAIDRSGKAFAFAYLTQDGRWRLENLAPDQKW